MVVDIIVPVYNVSKYLNKCIESLLAQTYKYIKIILVDDGSTDGSEKICDNYARIDDRINVIHKENGGLVSAWTMGIKNSKSEWVVFVDGDDWVEYKHIELLVKEQIESSADIVVTRMKQIDKGNEKFIEFCVPEGRYIGEKLKTELHPVMINAGGFERRGVPFSRCSKLIRKTLCCLIDNEKVNVDENFILELKKDIDFVYIPANRGGKDLTWSESSILARVVKAYLQDYTRNRDLLSNQVARMAKSIHKQVLTKLESELSQLNMVDDFGNYKLSFRESIDYKIFLDQINLYLDDEESMPVSEYGSGVKSLTVIALHRMLAKLNNVSIILGIEEPETNLHPQAQKKFIASLKDKRQDCETQAIFATHSTVIVDALDHQDIVLVRREKDEKRGFHSSTSQLPVDFWTLHNIAELKHYNFFKYRNSDFFFAKYVVITESITDAQVIERLIEPQLGDLYYNVSVLNLDGVKNLQYPFFLLSDLGIPFTAVVDKDVFLPYKNGKLMDSRNSETFLPEYSNTLNRRNPVLNAVFNTEELKDKLEEYVNQSYTKFVNYIEKYNMLSMQYCLEMDLVATDKASELYYDHYNLLGEKRNRKSLLIERKDAIKDPTVLLEIFDRLNPSEYPFSFKKIKNILVKKIKTAIITQRQNMEVEE